MKRLNFPKIDPIFLAILAAAGFLLFFNLDHRPFWQDEAETACLARNVLKYGVPKAFDGVNLISQEAGREFGPDYLWRWSPWLQIYVTAGAFYLGGLKTAVGRFPFALFGLASVFLTYLLVRRISSDLLWARLAAALLAAAVPFLLFARQCRYYSLGALLVLVSLYAFQRNWQSRWRPAALLAGSLALLFYSNYLLFFSYVIPLLVAAVLVYRPRLPLGRTLLVALAVAALTLPGLALFRIQQQGGMINLGTFGPNLENYVRFLVQFMIPLPVALGLLWFWWRRGRGLPQDQDARYILFLSLIILGNILMMVPVPQCEFRYLVHLYPLCAIILGWVSCQVWRYQKFSGVLLGLLLIFTNWLYLVPLDWIKLVNRPTHNDEFMLTWPNFPLKLYLTELRQPYPDVNANLIHFFQTHARPGDTILTTYGDLPLQFYTPFKVLGGLQRRVPRPGERPQWVVKRWYTRWNRDYKLNDSEEFVRSSLNLAGDYQAITLPYEDEIFGNRADPFYHRFVPPREEIARLVVHRRLAQEGSHGR